VITEYDMFISFSFIEIRNAYFVLNCGFFLYCVYKISVCGNQFVVLFSVFTVEGCIHLL